MRPVVAEVALEYRDVFSFVKLDVNTQPEKTAEYHIRGTPTYIVFRDGEIVQGFAGAMPKAELVRRILGSLEIEETDEDEREVFAGLQVQNLTPEIAAHYGYPSDEKGVVVTQVENGSNAAEKGIVPGSLIQEIEWIAIDDLESYFRLVEQLTNEKKKQVLLYVKSPNGQGGAYVTIKVLTSELDN